MRTQMPFTRVKPLSQKHWAVRKLPGKATAAGCEFGGHCCAGTPCALAASKTAVQAMGDPKNRSIIFLSAMPLNLDGLRCGGHQIVFGPQRGHMALATDRAGRCRCGGPSTQSWKRATSTGYCPPLRAFQDRSRRSTMHRAAIASMVAPRQERSVSTGVDEMILSRDRILTTHVGSLPRNEKLSDLLMAQEEGKPYDPKLLADEMDAAMRHVVKAQSDAGIDVGNDGEQRRIGFQTYVPQRMSGFAGVSKRRRGIEFEEFPELLAYLMRRFPNPTKSQQGAPEAQADISYRDLKPITDETVGFNKIADELGAFSERFMTAASPGIISTTMLNAHYESHDAYLDAIAREMSKEYQAIHKAGLILQIDAPDLAMDRTMMYRDLSDSDFVKRCERHVAAINKGIEGIPRDRVRLHVCYGNWEGPHIHDIPLETILPALYTANVGALSIEFSNPRHAHEYAALKKHKLPAHMLLIPGVVETTSNFVEHPEVVARRIEEAVSVVGDRERVIASTDCGFGTFTKREWVIEPVVWLKLKSIRQGADIASQRLWGKKVA
jgi:5-methyltetrahydropteroyltriglutamate--homocysteine methyltransferase